MKRVHIICEGQTEESFVRELLAPHLARFAVVACAALVGKPGHKGGHVTTERMTTDIRLRLLGDRDAYCTTFFDFYGLHPEFAGKADALTKTTFTDKAQCVEEALSWHLQTLIGGDALRRFIPYIQMYEFEGLLFSNPEKLAKGLYASALTKPLSTIRSGFATPEEINNSRETAPSKRILKLLPNYDKVHAGSLAALEIGLDDMRRECRRFDDWVSRLEKLGGE